MEPSRPPWRACSAYYGAPDLAVEIVSKSEGAVELDRKVKQYLNAGTTSVWVVYSEMRHVMVHGRSGEIRDFTAGQKNPSFCLVYVSRSTKSFQ